MKRRSIKDYFVGGFAVGLGFQIMEDISYIGSDGLANMDNLFPLVLSRVSGGWSSHWTYTAIFALGFYFIYRKKKYLRGFILCAFVFLNHFFWDSPLGEDPFATALLGASMIVCLLFAYEKYIVKEFI